MTDHDLHSSFSSSVKVVSKADLGRSLLVNTLKTYATPSARISASSPTPANSCIEDIVLINCSTLTSLELEEFIERNFSEQPHASILLYEINQSHDLIAILRWQNVSGIFESDVEPAIIAKGIKTVEGGGLWFPRQVSDRIIFSLRNTNKPSKMAKGNEQLETLTKREKQILMKVVDGNSNYAIAEDLNLSIHTIKTHLYRAYKKIGVSSRLEVVRLMELE